MKEEYIKHYNEEFFKNSFEKRDGQVFMRARPYVSKEKDYIVLLGEIDKETINYMIQNNVNKAIIEHRYNVNTDISFLPVLSDILEYLIIQIPVTNYEPIYSLIKLKSLTMSIKSEFDVSKLPKLEELSMFYKKTINLKNAIQLKSLSIDTTDKILNKTSKDLISSLINLDTLLIYNTDIENLDFLKDLKNLQILILVHNIKLRDITALRHLKNNLKRLEIDLSKRIESYDVLNELKQLVYLFFESNKSIDNLMFVSNMDSLKSLVVADTLVEHGDLTPLLNLPHAVVLPNKRSYYYTLNGKTYPIKNDTLPYGERLKGDDDIPYWRRIE